jgi:hypothetical protein
MSNTMNIFSILSSSIEIRHMKFTYTKSLCMTFKKIQLADILKQIKVSLMKKKMLTWSQFVWSIPSYSLKIYCCKPIDLKHSLLNRAQFIWIILFIFYSTFNVPWQWSIGKLTFLSPATSAWKLKKRCIDVSFSIWNWL